MTINFQNVPGNIRVPGPYIEIASNAGAQNTGTNKKVLVIGQKTSAGTVASLAPYQVTSLAQAITYFGVGSMLANMFDLLFQNNSTSEMWCVPMTDASGTAASGTITVTASGVIAGTISLYIAGVLVSVTVATGDAQNAIAAAIDAAINANVNLPVTSSVSTNVVTVTFKHTGTVGNSVRMITNYLGANAGEVTPTGVSLAVVQLASGATDPALNTAFAVLPDVVFDYMVFPYTNSANLNYIDAELNARWGSTRMVEGHAFVSAAGTLSAQGTLGNGRNNQHMSLFDAGYLPPQPPYMWVAALVGQVAVAANIDPAQPFTNLALTGILPSAVADRRSIADRQTLLYDGVATHHVSNSGIVQIERLTTCYQLNASSSPDSTYLDANTLFILSYLRQDLKSTLTSKFARFKLADDSTTISPGQAIVTPSTIKAQIVANAIGWASLGLIQDLAAFIASVVVVRNATDPTRVDCLLYPKLINQLQITATQIQFSL